MDNNRTIGVLTQILSELELLRNEIGQFNKNFLQIMENQNSLTIDASKEYAKFYSTTATDLKSCMETLEVIKDYEEKEKQGITAKLIAKMRSLSRAAVYLHLEELQKSNLVVVHRGRTIGLKPENANFYYASERDLSQTLWDHSLRSALLEETQIIANAVMNADEEGLTILEIRKISSFPLEHIEQRLRELLRQALINYYVVGSELKYFATGIISK